MQLPIEWENKDEALRQFARTLLAESGKQVRGRRRHTEAFVARPVSICSHPMPQPWYDWVTWNPKTRICSNINTDQGEVTDFVVAYEYKLRGSWETVAQFDHDPNTPYGHDIEEEGLHMDLYNEGQKYRVVRSKFPYVPVDHAPRYCIEYIKRNHGALIGRFERWHNVNRRP